MQAIAIGTGTWSADSKLLARLSTRTQIFIGVGVALVFVGWFVLTGSFLLAAGLLGLALVFVVVRNPVASLLAFIVINVFLSIRSYDNGFGNTPSTADIALALLLITIMSYWFVRLRLIEQVALASSVGQLLFALFVVWAVIVTCIGFLGNHSTLNNAMREMLNLAPLLILPLIYVQFVEIGSKAERMIFASVLAAGIIMAIWNFHRMHNNIIHAFYLYQVGRGDSDEMLSAFLVLLATSLLMSVRGFWQIFLSTVLLTLGTLGVIISLARTLYIVAIICMAGVLWLGDEKERLRGIRRLAIAGGLGIASLIPVYYSSRIIRLLLLHYGLRFLSAQHLGTDLSLVNRYVEWRYEWHAILQSPILGYGFGSQFRNYNIFSHVHTWMGFSHSSYLYILFKTGFIGAALLFGCYFSLMFKGFRLVKSNSLTSSSRIIMRAGLAYLVGVLINSYTECVFDSKTDLIWVGLIWGYILMLERSMRFQNSSVHERIYE